MATEKMVKKAGRLLVDGRVQITHAGEGTVVARVRGDHGMYSVERANGDRLRCSCPSLKWRCSHVIAVEIVTTGSTIGSHAG